VENDVDIWRYAIVSCMPETTTIVFIANFGTALHVVTETHRSPSAAFSQCLLCGVNAGSSCTADYHLNGNNNGT